jgi:putative AbiEi antitoxin of type IV toxin-antitoxin system
MNAVDRALAELAATQRQVFTRAQAIAAGLSACAVSRRLHNGLLVPVGTHTLTFAGTQLDWRSRLQAGLLDLGSGALVAAEAAAALHGLDGFEEGPLIYVVPRSMRRRHTIGEVLSVAKLAPLDRCVIDDLPTTSATLTVVQLIGRVGVAELGNAFDSAVRKRLTAPIVVERRLAELGRRGRSGIGAFDAVMEMAGVESWLERKFLALLRRLAIPPPAIQRTYTSGGVRVARVDFDFDPLPIIVEVGGRRGYFSAADRRRQEHRRNNLQLLGKTIYFFTTEDVTDDPSYVTATLLTGLGREAS